jgi:hypothetical protein
VEPLEGFEPPTHGLQNRSSTPELKWHTVLLSVSNETVSVNTYIFMETEFLFTYGFSAFEYMLLVHVVELQSH